MMRITIPWEALVSSNERNSRRGGKAHSKRYKTSLEACHLIASNQVDEDPLEGKVGVRLDFYPPDYRKRDLHNYLKMLFDALEGVAYKDDMQIAGCAWTKMDVDEENPRVEIIITKSKIVI